MLEWVVFKPDHVESPNIGFVQRRLTKQTVCMHTNGKYRAKSNVKRLKVPLLYNIYTTRLIMKESFVLV